MCGTSNWTVSMFAMSVESTPFMIGGFQVSWRYGNYNTFSEYLTSVDRIGSVMFSLHDGYLAWTWLIRVKAGKCFPKMFSLPPPPLHLLVPGRSSKWCGILFNKQRTIKVHMDSTGTHIGSLHDAVVDVCSVMAWSACLRDEGDPLWVWLF